MSSRHLALGLALVALLAGCGGSGSRAPDPGNNIDDGAIPVTFTPSNGYNGIGTRFRAFGISSSSTATRTVSSATENGRRFEIIFPTASFSEGDVFTPGAAGVNATYTQPNGRQWIATSGPMTASLVDANAFFLTFVGTRFDAVTTTGARGSFVAEGPIPITYGVNEGPGTVTFAAKGTGPLNGSMSPMVGATAGFGDLYGFNLDVHSQPTPEFVRIVRLALPKDVAAGATGTFGGESTLRYMEQEGAHARSSKSLSGSWRVLSRSRSNVHVQLTNVEMWPAPDAPVSSAIGHFYVNGTMRR